jgi:toxin-antitoxin system PIN domain toxin
VIVDANVLIYGVDSSSPFHIPAKTWLERALNGVTRVGLPWVSLLAFQRIVTHPRASTHPLTPGEAWGFIRDWLDSPQVWIPEPRQHHSRILERLITDGDLRGSLVPDAHLAALAIEHGVGVCSFDSDFARFPDLTWLGPV